MSNENDTATTSKQYKDLCAADPFVNGTKVPVLAMEEDFHKIPGQSYAVVSFIDASQYNGLRTKEGMSDKSVHLLKIRGVFSTAEKAEHHARRVQELDAYFDVSVIPTHAWTTIGAFMASEQNYGDDTLNDIMGGYFEKEDMTVADLQDRVDAAHVGEDAKGVDEFWTNAQNESVTDTGDNTQDPSKTGSGIPSTVVPMSCADAQNLATTLPDVDGLAVR